MEEVVWRRWCGGGGVEEVVSSAGGRRACHRLHAVHLAQLREPHEHAANHEAPGTKARRIERRYNEDAAQQAQQAADGTQEEVSAPKVNGFAVTDTRGTLLFSDHAQLPATTLMALHCAGGGTFAPATFRNRNSGALHKQAALLNEASAKSYQC